jgi:hypothetical protein
VNHGTSKFRHGSPPFQSIDKVGTEQAPVENRSAGGQWQAVEVRDTVDISRQARELAARAGAGKVKTSVSAASDLNKNIARVKKATTAVKTIRSHKLRLVLATGTILRPGVKTTVNAFA